MITNSILFSIIRILHYATDAEKTVRAGGDGLSKMDRHKSCCVDFAKSHLASSLVRQYARKVLLMDEEAAREYWNRHKDRIIKAIATVDHRIIISEDKDDFQTELRIVVAKDSFKLLEQVFVKIFFAFRCDLIRTSVQCIVTSLDQSNCCWHLQSINQC